MRTNHIPVNIYSGSIQLTGETGKPAPVFQGEKTMYEGFSMYADSKSRLQVYDNDRFIAVVDGFMQLKNKSMQSFNEQLLYGVYIAQGISFIHKAAGEFNLVLWDKAEKKGYLVRDHMGTKPFYYAEKEGFLLFSNDIRLLKNHFEDLPMSEEWLADLLSGTISAQHLTAFRNIQHLPPAHVLQAGYRKRLVPERYWDLCIYDQPTALPESDAVEQFRTHLESAVTSRIPAGASIGTELSGGLDSTVIASLSNRFCKQNGQPFYAFSHAMNDEDIGNVFPDNDEREYINQVIDFTGIQKHHFIRPGNAGIIETLETSLLQQGGPTQQRFYEFSDLLYATARQSGTQVLFSGFGGDEGVSSHGGGYLQEMMYKNHWNPLFRELRSKYGNPIKRMNTLVLLAVQVHLRSVYHWYTGVTGSEYKRIHDKISQLPLRKDVLKKYEVHQRAQEKSRFPDDRLLHERQYKRIMHAHVTQRMEYSAIAARAFGLEYRYPLWDKDFIQFYINLPLHLKRRNNTGRYIYRKSISGIIPEPIRWRNDKTGATIPSVMGRLMNDEHTIRNFIKHCKQKGIGTEFFEMDKMTDWLDMILHRTKGGKNVHQGMFFNYLMFLKYLEWKEQGKIK